jgi:hypothetical protein
MFNGKVWIRSRSHRDGGSATISTCLEGEAYFARGDEGRPLAIAVADGAAQALGCRTPCTCARAAEGQLLDYDPKDARPSHRLARDLAPQPVEGPGRHGCRDWRGQPDPPSASGRWPPGRLGCRRADLPGVDPEHGVAPGRRAHCPPSRPRGPRPVPPPTSSALTCPLQGEGRLGESLELCDTRKSGNATSYDPQRRPCRRSGAGASSG